MADAVQLAGRTNYGSQVMGSYVRLTRYPAIFSGVAGQMRCWVAGTDENPGDLVLGIYADSAGSPAELLATTGKLQGCGNIAANLTQNVNMTAGTYYWLAAITKYNVTAASGSWFGGLAKYGTFGYVLPDPAGGEYETRVYSIGISAWSAESSGAGRLIGTGNSRLIGGRSPLIGGRSPLIG